MCYQFHVLRYTVPLEIRKYVLLYDVIRTHIIPFHLGFRSVIFRTVKSFTYRVCVFTLMCDACNVRFSATNQAVVLKNVPFSKEQRKVFRAKTETQPNLVVYPTNNHSAKKIGVNGGKRNNWLLRKNWKGKCPTYYIYKN